MAVVGTARLEETRITRKEKKRKRKHTSDSSQLQPRLHHK
jgi:hypothetical protein